jgi:tetratricopeptide (TPR) repeat protein
MRFLSKFFALSELALIALTATFALSARAQNTPNEPAGRTVLVLPFDNNSGDSSLNWIGDSFPDTLDKRLNSVGFQTISHDDRVYAYGHLGLPADFRPTRATTIRIAQQLDANYVIVGSYSVAPTDGKAGNSRISIQARVLSVDALKLSAPVDDSAELNRLYDVENAIAWKVARAVDPSLSIAEQTFVGATSPVPLPAFEDYIRGTSTTVPAERLKRLQAAVALQPNYPAAVLALGKEQYTQRDYDAAAKTLAKMPPNDRLALEANFYLGLSRFNSADYAAAEDAFTFVASHLPLPEVVNDQGVSLSRQGKDGGPFYQKAMQADPSDEDYHYNFAVTLFRRGDTADALREVATALRLKPADNDAAALRNALQQSPAGTKLTDDMPSGFSAVERIRRNYSETSYRQAAYQLDQMRAMKLSMLPPAQRADEYTQIARSYLKEGLLPEAETQINAALASDPNSAEAHAAMAELREASQNPGGARDEAQTSLQKKPNVAAYLVLARLDMAAKQLPDAARDVAAALKLQPTDAQAIALKLVLQQRGQSVP